MGAALYIFRRKRLLSGTFRLPRLVLSGMALPGVVSCRLMRMNKLHACQTETELVVDIKFILSHEMCESSAVAQR